MDTKDLPTTPLAAEDYLRSLVAPETLVKLKADGGDEYPFLFGMATVKLAEANKEIARLRAQVTR